MKLLATLLLVSLSFGGAKGPIHLYMIGDSTMANKKAEAKPETGWGEVLQTFFNDKVIVSNHAVNGRSSKSFRDEGRWDVVEKELKRGDYVIIQFGHNDEKADSARHTDPNSTYKENLIRYIQETRTKGATPILATSIVRRKFDGSGKLVPTHGEYPEAARQVAHDQQVTLIDMEMLSSELVSSLGPEESKHLYLYLDPGQSQYRPDGVKDDTHLNASGATKIAELAINELKKQRHKLSKYLKSR